jgi:hypothetical protein
MGAAGEELSLALQAAAIWALEFDDEALERLDEFFIQALYASIKARAAIWGFESFLGVLVRPGAAGQWADAEIMFVTAFTFGVGKLALLDPGGAGFVRLDHTDAGGGGFLELVSFCIIEGSKGGGCSNEDRRKWFHVIRFQLIHISILGSKSALQGLK